MEIYTFENRYDREFNSENKFEFDTLEELYEFISEIGELNKESDKESVTYLSFSKSSDDKFKLSNDESNFEGMTGIMLDIDGKKKGCNPVSVKEFLKKFPYKCILHTTGSHSNETPSFRVMIPYDGLLSPRQIEYITKYILDIDDKINLNIDTSTFARFRGFASPFSDYKIGILNRENPLFDFEDALSYGRKLYLHEIHREKVKQQKYRRKLEANGNKKEDCSKFKSVIKYLKTSFNNKSGNGGDSDGGLFHCIMVCHEKNDSKTLELVLDKARSEDWTESELDRKIKVAENKYGTLYEKIVLKKDNPFNKKPEQTKFQHG